MQAFHFVCKMQEQIIVQDVNNMEQLLYIPTRNKTLIFNMKQIILTFFFCAATLLAQGQVRESAAPQAGSKTAALEQQEKEVAIYPNPNNGVFTISFANLEASQVDLRIINVIGNEIHHEVLTRSDIQATKTIDLTRFAKGLYYVKIETDGYSSVRRVVVK